MDNVDDFWAFVGAVEPKTAEAFADELARLPIPRIARFHRMLMDVMEDALTWELWAAADIIYLPWSASQDTFVHFPALAGRARA